MTNINPMGAKLRPRRVYFDIKKKTPYIIKNGKRVFIRLKRGDGGATIDHRTIKDKRQIVKVIVNTTKPHEVKSKPRRKRRIILAKKEEQTTKAGNERTIYVPHYMPFPEHSQQPITINVREGGADKEKSVVPTPVNVNKPKGITMETQTEGEHVEEKPAPEGKPTAPETPNKPKNKVGRRVSDYTIDKQDNPTFLKIIGKAYSVNFPDSENDISKIKKRLKKEIKDKTGNITAGSIQKYVHDYYAKVVEDIKHPTSETYNDIINNVMAGLETPPAEEVLDVERAKGSETIPKDDLIGDIFDDLEKQNPKGTELKQKGEGSGAKGLPSGAKGLTTKEINKLMKDEGYDVVKAIPSDCIPELVNDVNKKTEKFGFIINNEPHTQPGEHWRACFIDIPEGNVCWFDSLCGEPTRKEMKGIKVLIDKIKPEYYLKFKINRIKLQGDTTNCGWFCCKFIDDMMSGKKFKEATGWDVINGECGVENYKEKHGCMPERWGCI